MGLCFSHHQALRGKVWGQVRMGVWGKVKGKAEEPFVLLELLREILYHSGLSPWRESDGYTALLAQQLHARAPACA